MAATSLALSFGFAVHAAGATYAADSTSKADKSSSQSKAARQKVTEAPDVQSARLAAVLGGQRVEAVSERAADSTTWVNPDGSLTTETASGDIRVREGGQWKPIDTTLVDTGSSLEPKTAVADVALSDGGSGDFASVSRGALTFGLDWGRDLPEPRVNGATAVYPSVVPDGDLHVTALPHGFTESLILKKRPTEPVELRLPVTLEGMDLEKTSQRHLRLEDGDGDLVASAPAPRMWGSGTDSKSGDPARSAEIATTVEETAKGTVLVLRPSHEFLSDPTVSYPVTIDPTTTLAASTDTWVATNYPDSQRGSTELKAGTYDVGTTKARSYVKFDVSKHVGKHILSAELRLHSYWSSSCSTTGSGVTARRITESWDPSAVTWGAQPTTTDAGAAVSTSSYGHDAACPANFMRWNVADIAQAWADGEANHGLQIRGVDETDSSTWRRFRSANYVDGSQGPTEPALSVTYNTKPGVASPVSPASGTVTADTTPTLSAKATDPDGDTVRFTIEVWNADGTTKIASGQSPYTASAATGSWTAPTLAAGSYKWRTATYDGTDWNGTWSAWRTLTVDTSVPAAPALSSSTYPADGLWHGDAGQGGTFKISDPAGKAVSAEYRLNEGTTGAAMLTGGTATLSLTPATRGANALTARVKNPNGVWSEWGTYTFLVGAIKGSLSAAFINDIAETHFFETLHPPADDDTLVEDPPADESHPDVDDTPADFVEQIDPKEAETEDSAKAVPIAQLPERADQDVIGTSSDGNTQTVVNLPAATASSAELSSTNLVVYPNTQTDADTIAIRKNASAVEVFHLLRSSDAPTTFTYQPALGPGQVITVGENNTMMISSAEGGLTSFITAPLALDAKGTTVPVTMKLSGDDIVVSLTPAPGQTVAYPVLLDPGHGYGAVTPSERYYCFWNPYDCSIAHDRANVAFKKAQDLYPDRTLFQGTGDAFRHCYWNALMEIRLSTKDAYEIATRHESKSEGNDQTMDLRNNSIGRGIGRKNDGKTSAGIRSKKACLNAQKNGSLWIIKSGNLVRSDK
ncbi:Cell wall-associated polypeptide CWBP200 [Streptomyces sp. MA5143a]|nr:Cell wall-associated polypeptide CWBP200 [Streptomyces sp. MA5143a]